MQIEKRLLAPSIWLKLKQTVAIAGRKLRLRFWGGPPPLEIFKGDFPPFFEGDVFGVSHQKSTRQM